MMTIVPNGKNTHVCGFFGADVIEQEQESHTSKANPLSTARNQRFQESFTCAHNFKLDPKIKA